MAGEKSGSRRSYLKRRQSFLYDGKRCFSRKVTDDNRLVIKKAILCCESYHTRRALMYYQKAYPETEIIVRPVFPDGITSETGWKQKRESDR